MTIRRWTDKGELKSYPTPGGHRRYQMEDVKAFCEKKGLAIQQHLLSDNISNTKKVLVVDDDEQTVELIKDLLELSNVDVEVHIAYGGFAAGASQ